MLVTGVLLALLQVPSADPRAAIRLAADAIRADSGAVLRTRIEQQVAREPADRAARLTLATRTPHPRGGNP